jgi:hypothetical protein
MTPSRRYALTVLLPVALVLVISAPANIAARRSARTVGTIPLPLMFEQGAEGEYFARSRGYSVRLSRTGADIALPAGEAMPGALVTLTFAGASTDSIEGADRLGTVLNYLKGSAASWRTNVPTYSRVRMRSLYPGIDAVFYGTDRHIEYDFVVAPGADPHAISMIFTGADRVRHDVDGNLVISAGARELRQHPPIAYQEIEGVGIRVDAAYRVNGSTVTLAVGEYDRRRPLVIDPVLSYATFWGASEQDAARSVAADASGHVYIAGYAISSDFLLPSTRPHGGPGQFGPTRDAYLLKLSPEGTPIWMTLLGGAEDEYVADVAIGPDGDIFVTGSTASTDFPATPGAYDSVGHNGPDASEPGDAFVVKLSPDGNAIRYATYLGGGAFWGGDHATAIAVDAQGRAHIVGETGTQDFPVTIGSSYGARLPDYYNREAFVAKFSADGSRLEYSRLLAGFDYEHAADIAIDVNGGVYVVGTTSSTDFPVLNAVQPTKFGPNGTEGESERDGFLTHLWTDGTIVYSTYLGGPGEDNLHAIARGLFDRIYVAGSTTSDGLAGSTVPRPGRGNPADVDGMIVHLVPNASVILSTRYRGGTGDDQLTSLAVDPALNVWVGGITGSADMTSYVSPGAAQTVHGGGVDMYMSRLSPDLGGFDYGSFLGGSGSEYFSSVAVDANGNAYLVGASESADFPVLRPVQPTLAPASQPFNRSDGVIARFACTITVFGTAHDVGASAGTGAVPIHRESGCTPVVSSSATWLHVGAVGSDRVDYRFDANPGTSSRTATLDISGRQFAITQEGAAAPPPPNDLEIVLSTGYANVVRGSWRAQPSDAGGTQDLLQGDEGAPKITGALANPPNYFELTFGAEAGRPYRLWIRGRAERDYWGNDSVHVQFSGTVDEAGRPTWRIGTTSATWVSLEECANCGVSGYGWADNGWGSINLLGPTIRFAASGPQTIRVQQREDGLRVNQIVLSAERYLTASPGLPKNDNTVLPITNEPPNPPDSGADVVLYADAFSRHGNWLVQPDETAAADARLWNPNGNAPKLNAPLASPADYIEATFDAQAGRPYRLWLRLRAENDYWGNDSVWIQFSGAVTAGGSPVARIGTTSGWWINLEECSGCGIDGWGWQDDGYGAPGKLGTTVYFAASGHQTLRIQTREDGVSIDQAIISSDRFAAGPPGPAKRDTTIVRR